MYVCVFAVFMHVCVYIDLLCICVNMHTCRCLHGCVVREEGKDCRSQKCSSLLPGNETICPPNIYIECADHTLGVCCLPLPCLSSFLHPSVCPFPVSCHFSSQSVLEGVLLKLSSVTSQREVEVGVGPNGFYRFRHSK